MSDVWGFLYFSRVFEGCIHSLLSLYLFLFGQDMNDMNYFLNLHLGFNKSILDQCRFWCCLVTKFNLGSMSCVMVGAIDKLQPNLFR